MSSAAWLLIPVLPFVWLLSGYAVAHRVAASNQTAARLAWAILVGLGVHLLALSVVNFFAPLSAATAWLCVLPALPTLVRPCLLSPLRRDLFALFSTRKGALATALSLAVLALLLLPNLTRSDLVYYDGTANHDGFFWISGAKRLQAHTYLDPPAVDAAHPWANLTAAFSGWRPPWGRAGAETLLAFAASLAALDPVETYLSVTAALFFAWLAAVYLTTRAFWCQQLGLAGIAALVLLQPLFVFFRANGNLPNLLGVLAGAAAVIAVAETLRAAGRDWLRLAVVTLSVHACLFAYPEIFPFIALPCALLLLRAMLRHETAAALAVALAGFAGFVLNPATTLRAFHGFVHAFHVGRANIDWVDTFAPLHFTQYVPAFVTLSLSEAKYLGPSFGAFATVALVAVAVLTLARARDRYAALASFSGGAVLLFYTVVSGFTYGWQKSAQFSAVFLAALFSAAVAQLAINLVHHRHRTRWLAITLTAVATFVIGGAMVFHALEAQKWSRRKGLDRHWFALQALTRSTLRDAAVTVDAATFPMAFFHGMWAAYFMPDVRLSYAPRGELNGGYLRDTVTISPQHASPDAVLVAQDWAAAFDANSPWIFSGGGVALLTEQNVVSHLKGFHPANGVPQLADNTLSLDLRPHTKSALHLSLAIENAGARGEALRWHVSRHVEGAPAFEAVVAGDSSWDFTVPLVAGAGNHIELATGQDTPASFRVTALRLVPSR